MSQFPSAQETTLTNGISCECGGEVEPSLAEKHASGEPLAAGAGLAEVIKPHGEAQQETREDLGGEEEEAFIYRPCCQTLGHRGEPRFVPLCACIQIWILT